MNQIPSTHTNTHRQKPASEQIAIAAFHLYVENGCQDGHDLDHWLQAEKLLMQKMDEAARPRTSEPARKAVSHAPETRSIESHENLLAGTDHASTSRRGIRQKMTSSRPAARQPQWRSEGASPSKSAA